MEYEVLKFIWWLLIGVLFIGFAVTDGFDMGVGSLLKIIGKTDNERRVMINAVAPHWDGNQVWLITAGGALFAAWPPVYATAFSGFYLAMMVVLMALFLRPIGFDYRSKLEHPQWRSNWDWALTVGSSVPPLIIGVAFGNLLLGVPFHFTDILAIRYTGSFFALLNPFALLCGIISLLMFVGQGASYLQMKTTDALHQRARLVSMLLGLASASLFVLAGLWLWLAIPGYVVVSGLDISANVSAIHKTVAIEPGAWLANYGRWPMLLLVPLLGILGFIGLTLFSYVNRGWAAFVSSSLALASVILTIGVSMFPFVLPSSSMPDHSLTMWDATSTQPTLMIMFVVVCIFVPIVLGYTAWTYFKMRGRITTADIENNSHSLY